MQVSLFIYDRKTKYINHDRLFKELIKTFFKEFVEAFFPDHSEHIDFSTVSFMEQELFTDIVKGEKREIDILAQVHLQGKKQLILIHVEPQASYQKEFHERMFIYCSRLYEKYRLPILPIAVFSYNEVRDVPTHFSLQLPNLTVLTFNYLQVHLIKKNWRAFIQM